MKDGETEAKIPMHLIAGMPDDCFMRGCSRCRKFSNTEANGGRARASPSPPLPQTLPSATVHTDLLHSLSPLLQHGREGQLLNAAFKQLVLGVSDTRWLMVVLFSLFFHHPL